MILVLNLNASIDKRYQLDTLRPGTVMRAPAYDTAGGKGIHVARVARLLGEESFLTGFLGGHAGAFVRERLARAGLPGDFVQTAGETRCCLALLTKDGGQTEILEPGPEIAAEELENFREKYAALLSCADVVVASGSLSRGVPKDFYAELIKKAHAADVPFLLDTSGEALAAGIEQQPDFIKPNQAELAALLGEPVETREAAAEAARTLAARGVRLVCVSLGAAGSIAVAADAAYRVTVPHIDCQNPVGSGDSFVAGVATARVRGYGLEDLLRLAAACGTANAMEAESGFVRPETVRALLPQIEIAPLA